MTIASNLERINNAKTAIRTAIIEKGVNVPDTEKLDTYHEYIDQISGEPSFTQPDLSHVQSPEELANIQAIVAAGKASEYFELGQTILVPYDTYTMPFEIVGFENVEVEGGATVPAINLLAKYTTSYYSKWEASGTTKYSDSILRNDIVTTYQSALDTNFINCLSNTKTQTYSRDGTTDVVYDKLFAPSMAQIGVTNTAYNSAAQAALEGPAFTSFQGAIDTDRLKNSIDATNTARQYWTRSLYSGNQNYFGFILPPSGQPHFGAPYGTCSIVVACNLAGSAN